MENKIRKSESSQWCHSGLTNGKLGLPSSRDKACDIHLVTVFIRIHVCVASFWSPFFIELKKTLFEQRVDNSGVHWPHKVLFLLPPGGAGNDFYCKP